MDVRNVSAILIAKNCTRTADVQILNSATAKYYGAGELVITDGAGTPLTTATALKAVPEIRLYARRADGVGGNYVAVQGKDIVSYTHKKYVAPQSQAVYVDITEATKTNFVYALHFTSDKDFAEVPHRDSVHVEVGATALTKVQLVDAFVAKINLRFNTQNIDESTFRLIAAKVSTDKLLITAVDGPWDGLTERVGYQRFTVQAYDFGATIKDNKTAIITETTPDIPRATKGFGDYFEVMELEKTGRGFAQSRFGSIMNPWADIRNVYDTEIYGRFEADGTTTRRYDLVTIRYNRANRSITGDHTHEGAITLFLPVEDNDTSQVNAADGIVPILNNYIVTEWGVGTEFVPTA
jgi:hypothetical protein